MVKLFCAIVGVAGSAFEVDIDEGQKLFLAKTDDGAWLKSKDLLRMRKGEIPNETLRIHSLFETKENALLFDNIQGEPDH
ncbi:hypothetical protein Pcac1_g7059 [Phytophthora cactorum]|nr:hypothetical protein Pcac1_g7059 [Phytophthora cactorum]